MSKAESELALNQLHPPTPEEIQRIRNNFLPRELHRLVIEASPPGYVKPRSVWIPCNGSHNGVNVNGDAHIRIDTILQKAGSLLTEDVRLKVAKFLSQQTVAVIASDGVWPIVESEYQRIDPIRDWDTLRTGFLVRVASLMDWVIQETLGYGPIYDQMAAQFIAKLYDLMNGVGSPVSVEGILVLACVWGRFQRAIHAPGLEGTPPGDSHEKARAIYRASGMNPDADPVGFLFVKQSIAVATEVGLMFAEQFLELILASQSRKKLEWLCAERADPEHFILDFLRGLTRASDTTACQAFFTNFVGLPKYQVERLNLGKYAPLRTEIKNVEGECRKAPSWPLAAELALTKDYEQDEKPLQRLGWDQRNQNDKLVRRNAGALVDEETGASKHDALNHLQRGVDLLEDDDLPEFRESTTDSRPDNMLGKNTHSATWEGLKEDRAPQPYRVIMRGGVTLAEPKILQPGDEGPPPSGPPMISSIERSEFRFVRENWIASDSPLGMRRDETHRTTAQKYYPQSLGRSAACMDLVETVSKWIRRLMYADAKLFFQLNKLDGRTLNEIVTETGWTQNRAMAAQRKVQRVIDKFNKFFRDKPLRSVVTHGVRKQFLNRKPEPGSGLGWVFVHDSSAHYFRRPCTDPGLRWDFFPGFSAKKKPPARDWPPFSIQSYEPPTIAAQERELADLKGRDRMVGTSANFPYFLDPPLTWRAQWAAVCPTSTLWLATRRNGGSVDREKTWCGSKLALMPRDQGLPPRVVDPGILGLSDLEREAILGSCEGEPDYFPGVVNDRTIRMLASRLSTDRDFIPMRDHSSPKPKIQKRKGRMKDRSSSRAAELSLSGEEAFDVHSMTAWKAARFEGPNDTN